MVGACVTGMHPQGGEQSAEDFLAQKKWVVVRDFMDSKESALFDSVLSTRTLNPDKAVFALHFACADGDLGAIKKLIEKPHVHGAIFVCACRRCSEPRAWTCSP